jgi:hypothetical protein
MQYEMLHIDLWVPATICVSDTGHAAFICILRKLSLCMSRFMAHSASDNLTYVNIHAGYEKQAF